MSKQINCSSIIELLESRIANGQFEITESDLVRSLRDLTPIKESIHNDIDQDTTLLESIYNNIGKILED